MSQRFHLGCGDTRLDGYVNVDVRSTTATDFTADLNSLDLPELRDAECLFSHAFFEHLLRNSRVPHLVAAREALADDGFVCYLGLPDFERIARLYLERGPGVVGPVFDLYNVYRYTHGDPDAVGDWYFEQLHKSLFDTDEIERLLQDAGYPSYVSFAYMFPGETVRVSLGFLAMKSRRPTRELERLTLDFLAAFDGKFVQLDTVQFTGGESRPAVAARALGSPAYRMFRRVANAAAVQLARV
jgi:predicted SAM-dependent methyltransferase